MFQLLAKLQAICPAPDVPKTPLSAAEWNVCFRQLGTRLPEQLVQLNHAYGSGSFVSLRSPVNGSFGVYASVLSLYPITRLAELRDKKLKKRHAFPAELYFEPGGLLPFGWIAGGIDLCLRTVGNNPDRWQISLLQANTNKVEHLEHALLEVLIALAAGEMQSDLFSKHLPSNGGYRFEAAPESVQQWHAS
jgi:hypothetical protein